MKIFIGLSDMASQVSDLAKGFTELGIDTHSAIIEPHLLHATRVDTILHRDNFLSRRKWFSTRFRNWLLYGAKRKRLLLERSKDCDTFIFVWDTFYQDCSDLALLKRKGKKIVVFFMGSEQRWCHAYSQEMAKYGIPSYYDGLSPKDIQFSLKGLKRKIRYLRTVEKYADAIFSLPNQSQLALRPYQHFYIPADTSLIQERADQRQVPIVAHAPSKRSVKGTSHVLEVFRRLQVEGVRFEPLLIENVAYHEALRKYTDVDIVIGQLFIPSGGKLERECMSAGKVVLSSVWRKYPDDLPTECPMIDVNPNNLYQELKAIIADYSRRQQLANQGRKYVEKFHALRPVCQQILTALENPDKTDLTPRFFRDEYQPQSPVEAAILNAGTQMVRDSDWYRQHIASGSRAGLQF